MTRVLKNKPRLSRKITEKLSNEVEINQIQLKRRIESIFTNEREEIFEDGMESSFSKELVSTIKKYGDPVIEILSELIDNRRIDIETAEEAMRWLGHIDHLPTYNKRLWLLKQSLQHDSVRVRDGALLGLASLNDPDAISELKKAIAVEQCLELREDMEQILLELGRKY